MAQITVLTRVTGKAHLTSADEANDQLAISGLVRTAAGAATLYTDANTTSITVGASGVDLTIGTDAIIGPSDGTGLVIGQAGGAASTGSAPQVVSMTTAQRDNLVAANGMMVYNSEALSLQVRNNGAWVNVPEESGDSIVAVQPGIVSLGTLLDYPSNGGSSASEIQYARVYLIAGETYDAIQFFQESGGGAGRNVNLGIYDQATPGSTTGTPNNRVAETGTTATSSANNGTFVEVALTAAYTVSTTGYYWIAIIPDSANLKFAVSATYRSDFLPVRRESGTGSTLPATTGTLTNPSSALIWTGAVRQ